MTSLCKLPPDDDVFIVFKMGQTDLHTNIHSSNFHNSIKFLPESPELQKKNSSKINIFKNFSSKPQNQHL